MIELLATDLHGLAVATGAAPLAVFPFAMELVVIVLFAVVALPVWAATRLLEVVRDATRPRQ